MLAPHSYLSDSLLQEPSNCHTFVHILRAKSWQPDVTPWSSLAIVWVDHCIFCCPLICGALNAFAPGTSENKEKRR
jgi:hypothetical protein